MPLKCAECECTPLICSNTTSAACEKCIKDICCCIAIRKKNDNEKEKFKSVTSLFTNVKSLYAVALGIEILCISAAEIAENSSFALFGYTTLYGISLGYMLDIVSPPLLHLLPY